MLTVFTIGHSTRTWEEFLELLRAHGIERVVDVRSIPKSRHNPQFNRETLSAKLRGARISYVHLRRLGGLAPRAARFAEHGLAQRVVSRIRRLHADAGIREGIAEIDQIGEAEKDGNHVRGSGALAVPPFAHRRRAHRARDSRSAYCQREARPGSHSHFYLRVFEGIASLTRRPRPKAPNAPPCANPRKGSGSLANT